MIQFSKYLKYVAFLLFVIILSMFIFEGVYTYFYNQNTGRNMVFKTVNTATHQRFDVVVLGSSRAENHIDTRMFEAHGLRA